MPDRVGFTGTRRSGIEVERAIHRAFERIDADAQIITGGCIGADALVARYARSLAMLVHTIVPADRSRVDPDWRRFCTSFEEMPPGTDYRARNERIVECSTQLIAIPEYPEHDDRSRRSGTWMTVRIARRAGVGVMAYFVDRGAPAAP
jgi:hypothetical protein